MWVLDDNQVQDKTRSITFGQCQSLLVPKSDWEDALQDVFRIMLQTRYLERFDPDRGVTIEAYIGGLVRNTLAKRYRRRMRDLSLFKSIGIVSDSGGDSVSIYDLVAGLGETNSIGDDPDIITIKDKLEISYPHHSAVRYWFRWGGERWIPNYMGEVVGSEAEEYYSIRGYKVYPRSVGWIFYLLSLGWSQSDISEFFHVSNPWTTRKVAIIRKDADFLRWAADFS